MVPSVEVSLIEAHPKLVWPHFRPRIASRERVFRLRNGPDFELGHIESELAHEDNRPDLTIHENDGHVRVFIENQFQAGLTDMQPVSYLSILPEDARPALTFIVPEQRIPTSGMS